MERKIFGIRIPSLVSREGYSVLNRIDEKTFRKRPQNSGAETLKIQPPDDQPLPKRS